MKNLTSFGKKNISQGILYKKKTGSIKKAVNAVGKQ